VDAGPTFYLGTILTIAFVAGIGGSKLFAMLEPGSHFWRDPIGDILSFNGLSFFGGLICAGFLIIYYLHRKGFHLLTSVDAFAPGLILANAVGRIGCQLSGDGDWGIVNTAPKPGFLSWMPDWLWASTYPHNVAMEGIPIPGCNPEVYAIYCRELALPVYPTPVYETIMGVAMFGFLWMIRKRMPYPGLMTGIYLILVGTERLIIERIRVNAKYDFGILQLTQAELISMLLILGGIAILFFRLRAKKPLETA
jgi:prolipoprotein diacylglyceryltransferase